MMKYLFFLWIIILPFSGWAQETISGTVYDYENQTFPLQNVLVRNLTNQKSIKTKAAGQFVLPAKIGDLLEFSFAGYHTDTLFLINLNPKTIYLPADAKQLKQVDVVGAKVNSSLFYKDPTARPYTRFSDDNLYGKKNDDRAGGMKFALGYGRYQRERDKVKMLEEKDQYETEIRANFNETEIQKLVKLEGQDLTDFIHYYKPSVPLIKSERPFNYTYYIVKAYHGWIKMSPTQKRLPPVPKLKNY